MEAKGRKEAGSSQHTTRGARRGEAGSVSVNCQKLGDSVVRKLKKQFKKKKKMQLNEGHVQPKGKVEEKHFFIFPSHVSFHLN